MCTSIVSVTGVALVFTSFNEGKSVVRLKSDVALLTMEVLFHIYRLLAVGLEQGCWKLGFGPRCSSQLNLSSFDLLHPLGTSSADYRVLLSPVQVRQVLLSLFIS